MDRQQTKTVAATSAGQVHARSAPGRKPKLLDRLREALCSRHYSRRATMLYSRVLNRAGRGGPEPGRPDATAPRRCASHTETRWNHRRTGGIFMTASGQESLAPTVPNRCCVLYGNSVGMMRVCPETGYRLSHSAFHDTRPPLGDIRAYCANKLL